MTNSSPTLSLLVSSPHQSIFLTIFPYVNYSLLILFIIMSFPYLRLILLWFYNRYILPAISQLIHVLGLVFLSLWIYYNSPTIGVSPTSLNLINLQMFIDYLTHPNTALALLILATILFIITAVIIYHYRPEQRYCTHVKRASVPSKEDVGTNTDVNGGCSGNNSKDLSHQQQQQQAISHQQQQQTQLLQPTNQYPIQSIYQVVMPQGTTSADVAKAIPLVQNTQQKKDVIKTNPTEKVSINALHPTVEITQSNRTLTPLQPLTLDDYHFEVVIGSYWDEAYPIETNSDVISMNPINVEDIVKQMLNEKPEATEDELFEMLLKRRRERRVQYRSPQPLDPQLFETRLKTINDLKRFMAENSPRERHWTIKGNIPIPQNWKSLTPIQINAELRKWKDDMWCEHMKTRGVHIGICNKCQLRVPLDNHKCVFSEASNVTFEKGVPMREGVQVVASGNKVQTKKVKQPDLKLLSYCVKEL